MEKCCENPKIESVPTQDYCTNCGWYYEYVTGTSGTNYDLTDEN